MFVRSFAADDDESDSVERLIPMALKNDHDGDDESFLRRRRLKLVNGRREGAPPARSFKPAEALEQRLRRAAATGEQR